MRPQTDPQALLRIRLLTLACAASGVLHGCWWDGSQDAPAPAPAPASAIFTVGGSITGLTATGLVLADGNESQLSVAANATGFTLPTGRGQGVSYAVTVQTQPSGAHCSVSNASGTINGANVTNVAVACAAVAHTLGGTISGLASSGLVLANGTDTLSPMDGALSFSFAMPVAEGGAYAVAVQTQPRGETCSVGSGSGTMGTADIGAVQVTCAANAYRLGGTISGLSATGLILANGTDTVSPAANASSFNFSQMVAFGGSYSVTVQQQPTGLSCSVAGSFPATMGAGDVSNVAVSCAASTTYPLVAGRETCPATGPLEIDGTGAGASVPDSSPSAFNAAGNLYIASHYQTIRKVTPLGVVTTLAGQYTNVLPGTPIDGTGSAAQFGNLQAIAADSAGNLFVIDGNQIRKVTQSGAVATFVGSMGGGYADGIGTAAMFNGPNALTIDTLGNVYVVDLGNTVIRKVTPTGVVTTFAGTAGMAGSQDGTGAAAKFSGSMYGITIDASGNLFVDDGNRIRKITPAAVVTTLAGAYTNPGFADGTGTAARFYSPKDISSDAAGNLYVVDQNYTAIRKVTPAGAVTTVAVTSAFAGQLPAGAIRLQGIDSLVVPFAIANIAGKLYLPVGCAIETLGQ